MGGYVRSKIAPDNSFIRLFVIIFYFLFFVLRNLLSRRHALWAFICLHYCPSRLVQYRVYPEEMGINSRCVSFQDADNTLRSIKRLAEVKRRIAWPTGWGHLIHTESRSKEVRNILQVPIYPPLIRASLKTRRQPRQSWRVVVGRW